MLTYYTKIFICLKNMNKMLKEKIKGKHDYQIEEKRTKKEIENEKQKKKTLLSQPVMLPCLATYWIFPEKYVIPLKNMEIIYKKSASC